MIWAGVIVILIMAGLGAPLFAVLLAASMLGFYSADIDLAIVAIELHEDVTAALSKVVIGEAVVQLTTALLHAR